MTEKEKDKLKMIIARASVVMGQARFLESSLGYLNRENEDQGLELLNEQGLRVVEEIEDFTKTYKEVSHDKEN